MFLNSHIQAGRPRLSGRSTRLAARLLRPTHLAADGGHIPDHPYHWLAAGLAATTKAHTFVFGHEPAYAQADADNGCLRHLGDSLDQYPARRDRFWNLLQSEGVAAYIVGHTHNYSAVQIGGVWQLDVIPASRDAPSGRS